MLVSLAQDVRHGVRMLRRSAGFTTIAVVMLALGFGANTAIFAAIDAAMLEPLPYADAGRLVMVWEQNLQHGWRHNIVAAANFLEWKRQNHVFSDMAAMNRTPMNLTVGGDPLEVAATRTTANLFALLGVRPLIGRTFSPEEDRPHGARAAMLSYAFWQSRFGGDVGVIGKEISLDQTPYTVVGVLPAAATDLYNRFGNRTQVWTAGIDLTNPSHAFHSFSAIARLKPGVTLASAQREMDDIARRIVLQFPEATGWSVGLVLVRDEMIGSLGPALSILLGAAGFVLLIAAVNLANLFLARGAKRERELAVRAALGASRRRMIQQLIVESGLLALVSVLAGLVVALLGARLLSSLMPSGIQFGPGSVINAQVLGFVSLAGLATIAVFGVAPALLLASPALSVALRAGARGLTEGGASRRVRNAFVVVEFALALILVTGAGLMIRTLRTIGHIDLGIDPSNVLTLSVPLRGPRYATDDAIVQFEQELVARVARAPGVVVASASRGLPLFDWTGMDFVTRENPAPPPGRIPDGNYLVVGPDYFRALGIPLVAGRGFSAADDGRGAPVAIVSEELAREMWPGQNALGHQVMSVSARPGAPWRTVVGVVGDVHSQGAEAPVRMELYVPSTQPPWLLQPRDFVIRLRSPSDARGVSDALRRAVQQMDAEQPVMNVRMLADVIGGPYAQRRFLLGLLGVFGALALVLAVVGIYGVLSFSVAQRTREMGIRIALGAEQRSVVGGVLAEGMVLAAWGLLLGLAGALALTRFLRTFLYGVAPNDPLTLAAVATGLAAVAALACFVPARRAALVDPVTALRAD